MSWHGRQPCEKHVDRSVGFCSRRAQRLMTRSSSDSSYNPRASCATAAVHQLTDLKARVHSVDVPITQQPGLLYSFSASNSGRNSPPTCSEGGRALQNTKKSSEILVRKPKSSKPKPPPRKYFKQDCTCDDQGNADRRDKLVSEVAASPSASVQVKQHLQHFSCVCIFVRQGKEKGKVALHGSRGKGRKERENVYIYKNWGKKIRFFCLENKVCILVKLV